MVAWWVDLEVGDLVAEMVASLELAVAALMGELKVGQWVASLVAMKDEKRVDLKD